MALKVIVCFFVVFVLKKGICENGTLKEGDDGVCAETINEFKKVKTPYSCGLRKTCYQTKKVVVSRLDLICCEGWMYIDGRCIPEPPSCDPPCVNAECTSENNCTCERTFVHFNSTHCGPSCSLGYYNDPVDLSCVSKCTRTCINGQCTDYEKCTCNPGYKLSTRNNFECVPDCKICENGDCLAPNKCSCWTEYRDDNDGKCRPVCENCDHGQCKAPSVCECHRGYIKQSEKCLPVCKRTCLNGACVAPNVCHCYSNYTLDAADQFTCKPICQPECVNSACVSPNKCECNKGFKKTANDWTCQRPCETCVNSSCESPDKCTCCINGECIVSALCPCSEGYTKYNGTCVPITPPYCAECEGTCNDEVCSCHNGTACIKNEERAKIVTEPTPNCAECEGTCNDGVCSCHNGTACIKHEERAGIVTEPTLATMQLTWAMWGALVLLLTVIVCVVIHRMWKRSNNTQQKAAADNNKPPGSVVFTVPNTLMYRDYEKGDSVAEADEDLEEDQTGATLLPHIPTEDHVERM